MIILGIETAVDETAAAVVENGWRVLSSVVSTQVDLHAQFGGVVPEVAARDHVKQIIPVVSTAIREAGVLFNRIDAIAVSTTPGLLIALLVGTETAKTLSYIHLKPLVAVNDLESHAYAVWLGEQEKLEDIKDKNTWPLLYLIVSGGTTALVKADYFGDFEIVGQTRDDAAGEAFDKVAKLMGLGYPGGPAIERQARLGDGQTFNFPRPMIDSNDLDFSFSGLKTAVVYKTKELNENLSQETVNDISASFQEAVVDTLLTKTTAAVEEYRVKGVVVGGGVAANGRLREVFQSKMTVPVYFPPKSLCTDNAAMGAGCAYYYAQNKIFTGLDELAPFCYKNIKGEICKY
ncbi:tRNA (adenosine(37)-N6)-threonylcarbamoyltransferase complex transferase subunit TsaD [Patescibacteria group bacterium]|nr:tRNA (adenosine(37)-N6)-threonylcarbamoyltransferase complex transferase subunit TsaD [Patescibacteria group bacterium]